MTRSEIAKHVFAQNPKASTLYITSDGQPFIEKHRAQSHSQRLKDQSIEEVKKVGHTKEEIKVQTAEAEKAPEAAEKTVADQEAKEEAEAPKKGNSNQKSK